MFRVLGIYNFGSKCFINKKGKAVYKINKVKIPMVHFFPIFQITFLAFVIRKHENMYGGDWYRDFITFLSTNQNLSIKISFSW